ncbi:MAG: EamA family transporter [Actinobacteria bacterium]|uniref:Unannotated protein n=1 Tax=freshwater metagenome TaxID=449393 RepID=A0A6J7CZ39_9ZZZZ|nr:DMT family transporter [Actinomycetota bacterium]MSW47400.1 EamA family transporter [Actinomycetota bacterium]MSX24743.1 EamA family transporter [Actinomycetota bacterium]MSY45925.1 EamA family transporter [Actinomycetota bacterium]MSY56849.1 EamA family transporter [Actinomycetota bacterium]
MSKRGWVLFLSNSLIWGIPFWLTKYLLTAFSPSTIVFLRAGIAAAILLPFTWRSGEFRKALKSWRWVLVFALAQMTIPWGLTNFAQRHLDSAFTGLMMTAIPIIGLFYAFVSGDKQVFSKRGIAGLLLGLLGVGTLIGFDSLSGRINMTAVAMVLIGTCGYAYSPRVVNRHLKDVPSLGAVSLTVLITSIFWSVPAIATWPDHGINLRIILAALVIGSLCTALAFWIFFELIREVGPIRTTYLAFTNPMVAVLVGVLVANEPMTTGILASFPLIVTGTYLAISARAKS